MTQLYRPLRAAIAEYRRDPNNYDVWGRLDRALYNLSPELLEVANNRGGTPSEICDRISGLLGGERVPIAYEPNYQRFGILSMGVHDHNGDWLPRITFEQDHFQCSHCGEVYHLDDSHNTREERLICTPCSENHYRYDDDDEVYDLIRLRPSDPNAVARHDADVLDVLNTKEHRRFRFDGDTKPSPSKLYLGIELEVEFRTRNRAEALDFVRPLLGNFCLFKHDGSLGDGGRLGFEIVTLPMTWKRQLEHWAPFFAANPGKVLRSWDTGGRCGMHVHVNRPAVGELTVGKLLHFFGSTSNRSLVETFAGRTFNSYTRFYPKDLKKRKMDPKQLFGFTPQVSTGRHVLGTGQVSPPERDEEGRRYDRYSALNIFTEQNTIEFRIFRGTLNERSFFRNLETVHCLIAYCQQTRIDDIGHPANFRIWLSKPENRSAYRLVAEHLARRGLLTAYRARLPIEAVEV